MTPPFTSLGPFTHATVGVGDLSAALRFWTDNFGLEVQSQRRGPDRELARIWDLADDQVRGQALLMTPGTRVGGLHLVEFTRPLPPVRQHARTFDLLPKSLDLYTRDLPRQCQVLEAAGQRLRGPWAEMAGPAGLRFREVHLPGPDDLNVVLLEVLGPGYDTQLGRRGFAGIGPLVIIVPDGRTEARFWGSVLGLATTLELLLTGPDIERTTGLPPGAGLDLRVFGAPAEPLGRIEVIEYQGLRGENRYPRAVPPATGILHVNYRIPDLGPVRARLAAAGVPVVDHGHRNMLYGSGPLVSCRSPAGFRVEIQGGN